MRTAQILRAELQAARIQLREAPALAAWSRKRLDHALRVMSDYPTEIVSLEYLLVKAERSEHLAKALEQAERAHKRALIDLDTARARAQERATT